MTRLWFFAPTPNYPDRGPKGTKDELQPLLSDWIFYFYRKNNIYNIFELCLMAIFLPKIINPEIVWIDIQGKKSSFQETSVLNRTQLTLVVVPLKTVLWFTKSTAERSPEFLYDIQRPETAVDLKRKTYLFIVPEYRDSLS